MRLKGNEDCFCRSYASRTGKTVCQRDLCWGVIVRRNVVLMGDFVGILVY